MAGELLFVGDVVDLWITLHDNVEMHLPYGILLHVASLYSKTLKMRVCMQ